MDRTGTIFVTGDSRNEDSATARSFLEASARGFGLPFDASQWVTRLMIVNADGTGLSAVPGVDAARDPSWRPE